LQVFYLSPIGRSFPSKLIAKFSGLVGVELGFGEPGTLDGSIEELPSSSKILTSFSTSC